MGQCSLPTLLLSGLISAPFRDTPCWVAKEGQETPCWLLGSVPVPSPGPGQKLHNRMEYWAFINSYDLGEEWRQKVANIKLQSQKAMKLQQVA